MKKILAISALLVMMLLPIASDYVSAGSITFNCFEGGKCRKYNEITLYGVTLQFSAHSVVTSQPLYYHDKITHTRTLIIAKEGSTTIRSADTKKEPNDTYIGVLYSDGVKGRVYKGESTHYYYQASGLATVSDHSTSYTYP
ncbi:MAG TPA: hypothetical protein VKZ77_00715 [Bacillaceae bacterium]|nr:hypothetical protein [Paenibacillus bovis]HLU20985.1 hypothetical protein [Bacillaceae bacterium]